MKSAYPGAFTSLLVFLPALNCRGTVNHLEVMLSGWQLHLAWWFPLVQLCVCHNGIWRQMPHRLVSFLQLQQSDTSTSAYLCGHGKEWVGDKLEGRLAQGYSRPQEEKAGGEAHTKCFLGDCFLFPYTSSEPNGKWLEKSMIELLQFFSFIEAIWKESDWPHSAGQGAWLKYSSPPPPPQLPLALHSIYWYLNVSPMGQILTSGDTFRAQS